MYSLYQQLVFDLTLRIQLLKTFHLLRTLITILYNERAEELGFSFEKINQCNVV